MTNIFLSDGLLFQAPLMATLWMHPPFSTWVFNKEIMALIMTWSIIVLMLKHSLLPTEEFKCLHCRSIWKASYKKLLIYNNLYGTYKYNLFQGYNCLVLHYFITQFQTLINTGDFHGQ